MFEIGEIVVCINDLKQSHTIEELNKDVPNWVKKGKKYTIRGFTSNDRIVDGVWLEEVVNIPIYFKLLGRTQEPAFALWRFRKLEKSEVLEEEDITESVIELLEECNIIQKQYKLSKIFVNQKNSCIFVKENFAEKQLKTENNYDNRTNNI